MTLLLIGLGLAVTWCVWRRHTRTDDQYVSYAWRQSHIRDTR